MKSLCFRLLTASLFLSASILLTTPAMADTLDGATIAGTLTSLNTISLPLTKPFTSPAVVDPGVEFNGEISAPFLVITWDVAVDISANGFILAIVGSDVGTVGFTATDPRAERIYEITLSGLPSFVEGFTLTSYSCVDRACRPDGGNGLISNTFSGSTATLDFTTIGNGQTYTFADITAPVATPEPSTFALLGTGCLSMFGVFRRNFSRS
jgi:PEP-CTERM motif